MASALDYVDTCLLAMLICSNTHLRCTMQTPAEVSARAEKAAPAAVAALAAAAAAQLHRCCRDIDAAASPAAAAATAAQVAVLAVTASAVDPFLPPLNPSSRRSLAGQLLMPLAAIRRCAFWLDAGEDVCALPAATSVFLDQATGEVSASNGAETLVGCCFVSWTRSPCVAAGFCWQASCTCAGLHLCRCTLLA